MILRIAKSLRCFRKQQDGNATVEFAIYFTVFFAILAAGVEVAYMNLRHAMLERGVDLAVRDIRLNTQRIPTYTDVRETICAEATVLDACDGNLQLEMLEVDPRTFAGMGAQADCRNAAEEPRPYRNFVAGRENQLMLLRACLKYKPMLPFTSLGAELETDDDGYAHMLVTSAFVQEPR